MYIHIAPIKKWLAFEMIWYDGWYEESRALACTMELISKMMGEVQDQLDYKMDGFQILTFQYCSQFCTEQKGWETS